MIEWLLRTLRRTPPPASPAASEEAEQELRNAQAHLRKSEGEANEAHRVAGHLKRVNRENHFAERALTALRGIME